MGHPVSRRCHGRAATHAAALVVAMAAMANGARPAAPSAAARRLIALMEDEELEEQRRLAAEQRAARDKPAAAERAAVQRASTRRPRRSRGTSWPNSRRGSKCIGEAYGYDAAADPTAALDEQIEEVMSKLSLDGDVDSIYQGALMGLMTVEVDRRSAREFEA